MSMTTLPVEEPAPRLRGVVSTIPTDSVAIGSDGDTIRRVGLLRDLVDLVKPRISAMVLVTVALAVFVASEASPNTLLLIHCLVGTTLVAASSGALNQLLERDTDARMERTADRPLPAGRMGNGEVIGFGLATLIAGVAYLASTVGWQPTLWRCRYMAGLCCDLYADEAVDQLEHNGRRRFGSPADSDRLVGSWSSVDVAGCNDVSHSVLVAVSSLHCHRMDLPPSVRPSGTADGDHDESNGLKAGDYSVYGAFLLLIASLLPMWSGFTIAYAAVATGLGIYQLRAAVVFRSSLRECPTSENNLPSESAARGLLKASIIYLPLVLGLIAVHTAL